VIQRFKADLRARILIYDLNKTFTKSYLSLYYLSEVTEVFYLRQNCSTDGTAPIISGVFITHY